MLNHPSYIKIDNHELEATFQDFSSRREKAIKEVQKLVIAHFNSPFFVAGYSGGYNTRNVLVELYDFDTYDELRTIRRSMVDKKTSAYTRNEALVSCRLWNSINDSYTKEDKNAYVVAVKVKNGEQTIIKWNRENNNLEGIDKCLPL